MDRIISRHKTNGRGGLLPLKERATLARLVARAEKREHRRAVSLAHGQTRQVVDAHTRLLQRGFWGRLKWLLLGR